TRPQRSHQLTKNRRLRRAGDDSLARPAAKRLSDHAENKYGKPGPHARPKQLLPERTGDRNRSHKNLTKSSYFTNELFSVWTTRQPIRTTESKWLRSGAETGNRPARADGYPQLRTAKARRKCDDPDVPVSQQ